MSLLCDTAAKRAKTVGSYVGLAAKLVESGFSAGSTGTGVDVRSEDEMKLSFCLQALDTQDPFELQAKIPDDVTAAFRWQAGKTPEEVISEREYIVSGLEAEGRSMWASGACKSWLQSVDTALAVVSGTVNGPMMGDLSRAIGFDDVECIDLFSDGADLYGRMPVSSIGALKAGDETTSDIAFIFGSCV